MATNGMTKEEKLEKIKKMQTEIIKEHGEGVIRRMGDEPIDRVEFLSTGILSIDSVLGGGYARGRISVNVGNEASSKTTLALHTIAEAQKNNGICAFVDSENSLDLSYAEALGVDISSLWVSQPKSAEEAFSVIEKLIATNAYDIIVLDSLAVLSSERELNGDPGDSNMGVSAKLNSQFFRRISGILNTSKSAFIVINQYRSKIGIVFGSPEIQCGGNALKYYASQMLDMRKSSVINGKSEDEIIGIQVKIKCIKNKVNVPLRVTEVSTTFGKGIDKIQSLIDIAVKNLIIDKKGSWYSYGETKIGQGADAVKEFLINNPEIEKDITAKCRDLLFKRLDNEKKVIEIEKEKTAKRTPKKAEEVFISIPEEDTSKVE